MTEQSQVVALAAVPRSPRERFLDALEAGLSIAAAARAAGVGRQTVYDWRRREPEFGAAWDAAVETGTDRLEDEAHKRALTQSDTLMIFLLKARRPEKFRDRYVPEALVEGGDGVRQQWDFSQLTNEEFEAYAALSEKVRGPGDRDAAEIVRGLAGDKKAGTGGGS